ncbi:thioredoxin-like protein 1 [Crassostrea angulata]|uniref:Thioredoxin-like protein 1 n=1 Tax=Magallana gigas TaxID=29159 RepID=A0A8W8P6T5_MAGGI|nr:thioredoxin-like protein 1 [Crassostrea gigas]XP_052693922.1 thioredoxin-like protein 1 [Crassostrea angulata]
MTGTVRMVTEDSQFQPELANAGTKLVVVDYYATWCGPCRRIAPVYGELSLKYPNVVFLKVDVDQCQETAQSQGVTAMPTFIFYKNKVKVDEMKGADAAALEEKIKRLMGDGEEGADEVTVKGHMDLASMINKSGCECLNESDEHTLSHALTTKGGYLESDCDEQLLISVEFTQSVKLHSLKLYAPEENGPKMVKIFQNVPRALDFDQAESNEAVQILELTPADLKEGTLIPLRYVKFQNVGNVTVFIKDNQTGAETTQIDYIGFVGSPLDTTNMSEFKRVAGKKGESH